MDFAKEVENGKIYGRAFKSRAIRVFDRAKFNFYYSRHGALKPYYDFNSHLISFAYPFCHAVQLMFDLYLILYGTIVLTAAVINGRSDSADMLAYGLSKLLHAAAYEIFNIIISLISLVIRSGLTIFGSGYSYKDENSYNSDEELREDAFYLILN